MIQVRIHYIYDPLCGWCYGASPLVAAALEAGFGLVMHGGGLFAEPMHFGSAKRAYVRSADARIGQLTGQRFGAGYMERMLDDPDATFWSIPPIAAILDAERVANAGPAMLVAIQKAHYVDGRNVSERDTLLAIGKEIGLDRLAIDMRAADDHINQTRALMARTGLNGYPGFLVECGDTLMNLAHESLYGRPEAFRDAARRAAVGDR